MITTQEYFGSKINHPETTMGMRSNAIKLLEKVNALLKRAEQDGAYSWPIDPDTGTNISGSKDGAGDGGFRLPTSTTGAPKSPHKDANGVDVYDPVNSLDNWITDDLLEEFGLYREAPAKTPGWAHLQGIPPRSGKRTYSP